MHNINQGKSKGLNYWAKHPQFKRGVMDFVLDEPFDYDAPASYEYGRLFAAFGGSLNDVNSWNKAIRENVFGQRGGR